MKNPSDPWWPFHNQEEHDRVMAYAAQQAKEAPPLSPERRARLARLLGVRLPA